MNNTNTRPPADLASICEFLQVSRTRIKCYLVAEVRPADLLLSLNSGHFTIPEFGLYVCSGTWLFPTHSINYPTCRYI
jgi:hypothetical protein